MVALRRKVPFVLASRSETFGLVILEAWAASSTVVASRTSGASDLIDDGDDGYLFDIDDGPTYVEAIRRILDEPEHARAMGERGAAKVAETYDQAVPTSLLDRLYRPFLDHAMPVTLATIPDVRTDARTADGEIEVFVHGPKRGEPTTAPIGDNAELVAHLRSEPGYHVAMHGCHHEMVNGRFEMDRDDRADLAERLERGLARFLEAGLPRPTAFVAPQDQISRTGVEEVMRRFTTLSTGYFDVSRVPRPLLASYLVQKKAMGKAHFRAAHTSFLTHPGCILARGRSAGEMIDAITREIRARRVTVIVSHHSEYFGPDGEDAAMFEALHALPELFARLGVRVIALEDAATVL
jgi:hypothetical protein